MKTPPPTIDGARVLKVADVGEITPTGKTRHTVGGREVVTFAGLVIARYDGDAAVYLFYCDADWNVISDTYHDDVQRAISQAEFEFGPVAFVDVPGG